MGLTVSVLFLGLLLWRIDFSETARSLRAANYLFILPGVIAYFGGVWARAIRWQLLLLPLRRIEAKRLFPVVAVGYMANNLLPMRLGELVRSYYLGQREGVSKSAALATIIVERVVDGVTLMLILVALSVTLPVTGMVQGVAEDISIPWPLLELAIAAPFVGVLAVMMVMAHAPSQSLLIARAVSRPLPSKVKVRVLGLVEMFISGMGILRYPWRVILLLVLSLVVWICEGVMYYVVGLAFGMTDSLGGLVSMAAAMLAVLATSNLGAAVPSSQGSIGPFELFAVATLVFLGISREAAVAYSVVLHVALLVPVTFLGLMYLWMGKESLVQLVRLGTGSGPAEPSPKAEGVT